MRTLYPAVEPRAIVPLPVGDSQLLHVEDCGRADGLPILFLHGGPGSGCKPYHRQFFDATRWRPVLFDQRGAGRSTPRGGIAHNDSQRLVADIEAIREHLGIERWALFGGSWGAALALLYAQTHPQRVTGMILRGTFLARPRDVDWFFGDGARRLYPDRWAQLCDAVGSTDPSLIVSLCHALLRDGDRGERERIARAWADWSGAIVAFSLGAGGAGGEGDVEKMIADATIEAHYAVHGYFLRPNQLLEDVARLPDVPVTIIHGRRDLTCPFEGAWALHRALPRSKLVVLHEAGHLANEPAMIDALVAATDELAELIAP